VTSATSPRPDAPVQAHGPLITIAKADLPHAQRSSPAPRPSSTACTPSAELTRSPWTNYEQKMIASFITNGNNAVQHMCRRQHQPPEFTLFSRRERRAQHRLPADAPDVGARQRLHRAETTTYAGRPSGSSRASTARTPGAGVTAVDELDRPGPERSEQGLRPNGFNAAPPCFGSRRLYDGLLFRTSTRPRAVLPAHRAGEHARPGDPPN